MTPLRLRPVTSRHNVARLEEVGIDPDTHAHVMLGVDAVSADTVPGTNRAQTEHLLGGVNKHC